MTLLACLLLPGEALAENGSQPEQSGRFSESVVIHPDQPQQLVWGMGFELQSDSIASGNHGLPTSTVSVPHDLTPPERDRLADEMLKGFRYCRLAGGLYWRGLDVAQKQFEPRWPEQLAEIKSLLERAGVKSLSFEYWSPAPFWKANRVLAGSPKNGGQVLRCFSHKFDTDPDYHGDTTRFLSDFSSAVCRDIQTLQSAGLKVGFFGLQNEPFAATDYSSCVYNIANYGKTFVAVASAVRKLDPSIKIIADTGPGELKYIAPVMKDPNESSLVDCLVVHTVGWDSSTVRGTVARARELVQQPLPLYQNEFEYLNGGATASRCLNTVQSIMNWYQLAAAPTWYWIHCLKPIGNSESSGYALGFWRPSEPSSDPSAEQASVPGANSALSDLQPGHFTWNNYNWFSVAGFLKHMPWNSTVVKIEESKYSDNARVLAFKRPDGKLVIVVSNRAKQAFTFHIATGLDASAVFRGFGYTPENAGDGFLGQPLDATAGAATGAALNLTVPTLSWQFWIQQ